MKPENDWPRPLNYMTFEQAVNSSEPNDRLINEVWFQDFKKSVWKETILQGACALCDKWQVKKAEPKVLTAEELVGCVGLTEQEIKYIETSFIAGNTSGQLKQWVRHKLIREAIQEWLKIANKSGQIPFGYNILNNALNEFNLTSNESQIQTPE